MEMIWSPPKMAEADELTTAQMTTQTTYTF